MRGLVVITCLLALSVPSRASGYGGLVYAPEYASPEYYSYPSYEYEYSVRDPHTGDNKAVWEKRDGDVVIGGYSFVEPGGSIRVVEYRADKSGFTAPVVKRIGPKVHPGGATSTTTISKPSTPIREIIPARIIPSAPIVAPAPIIPASAPVHIPLPAPVPIPAPAPVHIPAPLPVHIPAPAPIRIPSPIHLPLPGPIIPPIYNPLPLPIPIHPAPYFPRPRIPIPIPIPSHGIGYNHGYNGYNLGYH